MADFANGGKIDPRATFTRASTANVFNDAKHLSSDNLLLQSSDFDTTWTVNGLSGAPASGQTDPSGGTDGFTLVEDSSTGVHRICQNVTASGNLTLTVYAKQNSGTRYLTLSIVNTFNDWVGATYDLAGGSPSTGSGSSSSFSGLSATQTSSGNSYYKCVLSATGSMSDFAYIYLSDDTAVGSGGYGAKEFTGDGSSSIDLAFASLSTVGATDYNATTTQIHREYAPSLVSKANNAARFETATDGQSAGTSLGCLIESQATSLVTYSEDFTNGAWVKARLSASTASAVAPDGTLTANQLTVDGTASNTHSFYFDYTTGGATAQTVSFFVKAGTLSWLQVRFSNTNSAFTDSWANYNLSTGAIGTISGGVTASTSSCGNGWYRIVATQTALTNATGRIVVYTQQADNTRGYDGNSYDYLLIWGGQIEANQSFASSYIKSNSGSATTRALDSLSVDLTQAGYTGGPVSVITETTDGQGSYPRTFSLSDGTITNYANIHRNGAATDTSSDYRVRLFTDGASQVNRTATGSASATKIGVSIDTNSVISTFDGGSSATDSSAVINTMTELRIGDQPTGGKQLNGTCKRISVYGTALSQTELEALTS